MNSDSLVMVNGKINGCIFILQVDEWVLHSLQSAIKVMSIPKKTLNKSIQLHITYIYMINTYDMYLNIIL